MINILLFLYFRKCDIGLFFDELCICNYICFILYIIIFLEIKGFKIEDLFGDELF